MIGAERYRSAPFLYNNIVKTLKVSLLEQKDDLQSNVESLNESLRRKPLGSLFVTGGLQ
jgi:hypothetical protein